MTERKTYIGEGMAGGEEDPLSRREGDALAAELAYHRDLLRRLSALSRDLAIAVAEPDAMHDYGGMVVRSEALLAVLSDPRE